MVTHGLENSLIFNHMLFPQVKEVSDNAHVGSQFLLSLLGADMAFDTSSLSSLLFSFKRKEEKRKGKEVKIPTVRVFNSGPMVISLPLSCSRPLLRSVEQERKRSKLRLRWTVFTCHGPNLISSPPSSPSLFIKMKREKVGGAVTVRSATLETADNLTGTSGTSL